MQFSKIRLVGLTNVDLPIIGAAPSDPYILKAADGLGPVEVDVAIAPTLNMGGVYGGRQPLPREVVVRVGLNPNYSSGQNVDQLRTTMYGMLTTQDGSVMVQIMNNNTVVAQTLGYVKRIEVVPFSKEPEVQITIPCLKSFLEKPSSVTVVPTGKSPFTVQNEGTAPAGFYMEVVMTAGRSTFTLTQTEGLTTPPFFTLTYPFATGDIIKLDTRRGRRTIKVTRGAVTSNILDTVSDDSEWPELFGGLNTFYVSNVVYNWNEFTYTPQYWGI